jgi:hypothetical protein
LSSGNTSSLLDFINKNNRKSNPQRITEPSTTESLGPFDKRAKSNRESKEQMTKKDGDDSFEKTDMEALVVAAASVANSNQSTPISTQMVAELNEACRSSPRSSSQSRTCISNRYNLKGAIRHLEQQMENDKGKIILDDDNG